MAETVQVFVESGQRRVFAGALEWPGWCRSARDEESALESLAAYGPRYATALAATGTLFSPPDDVTALTVVVRVPGDATTDFGAPGRIIAADHADLDDHASRRLLGVLQACWATFDRIAADHRGVELRKGPRGGGRDVDRIVDHVLEADGAYLEQLGGRWKRDDNAAVAEETSRVRNEIVDVWSLRMDGQAPPRIPRRGAQALWPLRYFVRRSAWHALDHAWEIEDRADGRAEQ